MKRSLGISVFVSLFVFTINACQVSKTDSEQLKMMDLEMNESSSLDTATFGAGCFWCVEAVFQELKGVISVTSGYAGGAVKNPTYKEVCTGRTGCAEVAQIVFDPNIISFDELLEVFWQTHDPTTSNRQGNDVGTQYRSSVFYHDDAQRQKAEFYKNRLNEERAYPDPVVTTIEPFSNYSEAEKYHQDYFNQNADQPYCTFVIQPKVEKFRKAFSDKLKSDAGN
mgnify:CR=1 FL=1|jgi:peptide-methionine (S)-S-oxide reductase